MKRKIYIAASIFVLPFPQSYLCFFHRGTQCASCLIGDEILREELWAQLVFCSVVIAGVAGVQFWPVVGGAVSLGYEVALQRRIRNQRGNF